MNTRVVDAILPIMVTQRDITQHLLDMVSYCHWLVTDVIL